MTCISPLVNHIVFIQIRINLSANNPSTNFLTLNYQFVGHFWATEAAVKDKNPQSMEEAVVEAVKVQKNCNFIRRDNGRGRVIGKWRAGMRPSNPEC